MGHLDKIVFYGYIYHFDGKGTSLIIL